MTYSEKEVHILVQDLYASGSWFQFPVRLLDFMTLQQAVLFSYLSNHAAKCGDRHGKFYCRMDQIMKDLRISRNTQTRLIGQLEEMGYITSEMKGMPPRRWLVINWKFLIKELMKSLTAESRCNGPHH